MLCCMRFYAYGSGICKLWGGGTDKPTLCWSRCIDDLDDLDAGLDDLDAGLEEPLALQVWRRPNVVGLPPMVC